MLKLLSVLIVVVAPGASKPAPEPTPVKAIVWSASWCTACKHYEPVVEELKKEGWEVQVFKVDEHPGAAKDWGVQDCPIPRTIIYTPEKKLDVFEGCGEKRCIRDWFAKFNVFKRKVK
jgi:thiol-disulfide isomerase/thioredoxin